MYKLLSLIKPVFFLLAAHNMCVCVCILIFKLSRIQSQFKINFLATVRTSFSAYTTHIPRHTYTHTQRLIEIYQNSYGMDCILYTKHSRIHITYCVIYIYFICNKMWLHRHSYVIIECIVMWVRAQGGCWNYNTTVAICCCLSLIYYNSIFIIDIELRVCLCVRARNEWK